MYKRRGGVSGKCGKWDWDVNVGYEGVCESGDWRVGSERMGCESGVLKWGMRVESEVRELGVREWVVRESEL